MSELKACRIAAEEIVATIAKRITDKQPVLAVPDPDTVDVVSAIIARHYPTRPALSPSVDVDAIATLIAQKIRGRYPVSLSPDTVEEMAAVVRTILRRAIKEPGT